MNTEQIPTVKESLQVENTTFDLDWAKIGQPVIFMGRHGDIMMGYYNIKVPQPLDMEPSYPFIELTLNFNNITSRLYRIEAADLRMATRAECEAAGVEYIEPPPSSEDESAMLMIAHLNGYEAGKKDAETRIKELEDGIRNLYEADTRTSYTPTADRISACEQLYKLIGIEV